MRRGGRTAATAAFAALVVLIGFGGHLAAAAAAAAARSDPSRFPALLAQGQAALAARDYAGAQEALAGAVTLKPNDPIARYALARAYGEDKKYQPATLHLKETLRLLPNHQAALCDLAAIAENSGRFEEASAFYTKALESGESLRARRGLASLHSLQGRAGEAEKLLRDLVASNPADAEMRYALARALTQGGDCAGAIPHFEKVLAADARHLGALFNLGNCLNRLGRAEEAAALHARFAKVTREEEAAVDRRRRAYFLLLEADRKIEAGDFAAALDAAGKAAAIDPSDPRAQAIRGQALDLSGDRPGALKSYLRAAELDPRNAFVLVEVGRLLGGQGRFAEAIPWLERAAKADPSLPEPHYLLAAVYHETGRPAQAAAEEALYRRLLAGAGGRP